jgi:transposase
MSILFTTHFSVQVRLIRKNPKKEGKKPVLNGSRWCFIKRPENLTEKQDVTLKELIKINLTTIRAYLLKEDFQFFWDVNKATRAVGFLDSWCKRTMQSKIEPMKKIAKMLRSHQELILNWFHAKDQISLGAVEGLNNKAKTTSKKAYGFRSYEVARIALFQTLGDLPEPKNYPQILRKSRPAFIKNHKGDIVPTITFIL